jgi:hypothetical protein
MLLIPFSLSGPSSCPNSSTVTVPTNCILLQPDNWIVVVGGMILPGLPVTAYLPLLGQIDSTRFPPPTECVAPVTTSKLPAAEVAVHLIETDVLKFLHV